MGGQVDNGWTGGLGGLGGLVDSWWTGWTGWTEGGLRWTEMAGMSWG